MIADRDQKWLAVALLMILPVVQADSDDHERARLLRETGKILPLSRIVEIYRERYPSGRILEAELEAEHGNYVYELEVLLGSGQVLELEYDARSGELLNIEEED